MTDKLGLAGAGETRGKAMPAPTALLVLLIALHSILLGTGLLLRPLPLLQAMGWDHRGDLFFVKQSGCFLVTMGTIYLAALAYRPFTWVIVYSKAIAALFLLTTYFLSGERIHVFWAGILDGLLGAAVALMMATVGPRRS